MPYVIVSYVTSLYLALHLNFLYLHLNVLAPRSGIIYSSWSRKDWNPRTHQNPAWRCISFLWRSLAMTWQKSRRGRLQYIIQIFWINVNDWHISYKIFRYLLLLCYSYNILPFMPKVICAFVTCSGLILIISRISSIL